MSKGACVTSVRSPYMVASSFWNYARRLQVITSALVCSSCCLWTYCNLASFHLQGRTDIIYMANPLALSHFQTVWTQNPIFWAIRLHNLTSASLSLHNILALSTSPLKHIDFITDVQTLQILFISGIFPSLFLLVAILIPRPSHGYLHLMILFSALISTT